MGVRLIGATPKRMTPARRRLIEVLSDGPAARQNPTQPGKPASAPG